MQSRDFFERLHDQDKDIEAEAASKLRAGTFRLIALVDPIQDRTHEWNRAKNRNL